MEKLEKYSIFTLNVADLSEIKSFSERLPAGTVVYRNQPLDESPAETSQPVTSQNPCPTTQKWLGDYNFQLSFEITEAVSKSKSWTYSEKLNKLFVSVYKLCPIRIKTNPLPPQGTVIRALPVFSQTEHISEIVRRCPNHSGLNDLYNEGHPAPDHLVRCDLNSTEYQTCPQSGRLSIVMPYYPPEAGSDYTTYLLQFMCYGSCVGGLNRRPIQMIFTLEKDNQVLGRQVLPTKICACPGRDRKGEECSQITKTKLEEKSESICETFGPSVKRLKTNEEEFIIRINKKEHYELLHKIKVSLELADMVTEEQLKAYQYRKKEAVSKYVK